MPEIAQTRLNLKYRSRAAGTTDLQAEISNALHNLSNPTSDLAREASHLGFMPDEFLQAHVEVDQEAKGFGDVIILIAIFAPAANHALRNVWDDLIWPHIKSELGADALGDEVYEDESDEDESDESALE